MPARFAPGGFAVANGQLQSIATNQVLFSQIGTTYGGNGLTNFALPNLSGRTVVGTGQGTGLTNRPLGSVAGATTETLTANQLPPYGGASGINAGSQPVSTLQPSLALNEVVVTQGFFPSSSGPQAPGPIIGQVLTYAGPSLPNGPDRRQWPAVADQPKPGAVLRDRQHLWRRLSVSFADPEPRGPGGRRGRRGARADPAVARRDGGGGEHHADGGQPAATATDPANGTKAVLGGGQPFSLQQPTLALQYIIAVQGIFPTTQRIVPDGLPFLGEISLFAGTVAPAGWDFADGQLLSIAANQALFAVIGTTYGGNGIFRFRAARPGGPRRRRNRRRRDAGRDVWRDNET